MHKDATAGSNARCSHEWTDRIASALRDHGMLLEVEYGELDDEDSIRGLGDGTNRYVSVDAGGCVFLCITQPGFEDVENEIVCLSDIPEELDRQLRQIADWLA
jgi:hypothetical protein